MLKLSPSLHLIHLLGSGSFPKHFTVHTLSQHLKQQTFSQVKTFMSQLFLSLAICMEFTLHLYWIYTSRCVKLYKTNSRDGQSWARSLSFTLYAFHLFSPHSLLWSRITYSDCRNVLNYNKLHLLDWQHEKNKNKWV